jgi:hypothetical protein
MGVRRREARRDAVKIVTGTLRRGTGSQSEEEIDMLLRTALFTLAGAGLGFGVHRFVGCRTGACPIWASPYASTIYGALLGLLLAR